MDLKELVNLIDENPSTLFLGAGFSKDSGGPGGAELLRDMKMHFGGSSELDFFNYLENYIGISVDKRRNVEERISFYLKKLSPTEDQKYLLSIPWKAVFTTNYDRIPDYIQVTKDNNRTMHCIYNEDEEVDITRDDRLYCFKVFGDVSRRYREKGYMVLTKTDRRAAAFRIIKFYNLFKDLVLSGNIVYLGYSFNDGIIFEILKDIHENTEMSILKGYAIMPHKPDKKILEQFEMFNIELVIGDLSTFVKELINKFGETPISCSVEKKVVNLKNVLLEISRPTIINVKDQIKFINESDFISSNEDPKLFFEGKDQSFYPYIRNWDFNREVELIDIDHTKVPNFSINSSFYVLERQSRKNSSDNIKICMTGSSGSGKTILTKRIAYEWYKKGHPVILINPIGNRLDRRTIEGFIEELSIQFTKSVSIDNQKDTKLRYLMIADNQMSYYSDIIDMYNYLTSKDICIDLLITDRINNVINIFNRSNFDGLYIVNNTISSSELKKFSEHISNINLDISHEILAKNINDITINESFFALMYSTIKETQKPLKEIIEDEYRSLDPKHKEIYSLISLLDTISISSYINLICKYTRIKLEWILKEINYGKFNGILQIRDKYIYTNHKLISEIIDSYEYSSPIEYYKTFENIVDNFTIGNYTEEKLIHNILIDKLDINSPDTRLNPQNTIALYEQTIKKLETRPLYIHLAKYYSEKLKDYPKAKKTIKRAYKVRHRLFPESDTHLQDTEARIELDKVEQLIEENRIDGNEIWDHLEQAENIFDMIKGDITESSRPYQGMAQTFYYYAHIENDIKRKTNYCVLGLSKINYINKNSPEGNLYTKGLEIKILKELDGYLDEYTAQNMLDNQGNPDGYAVLADRSINGNKDYDEALYFVNKGIIKPSVWLLRLKLQIIKILNPYEIKMVEETIKIYQDLNIIDLELTFEVAKYYFIIYDYVKSCEKFEEIKGKGRKEYYEFDEKNILYDGIKRREFRGGIKIAPTHYEDGVLETNDISKDFRELTVKYDDIKYTRFEQGHHIVFNIYFTYNGPQAMNVTPS